MAIYKWREVFNDENIILSINANPEWKIGIPIWHPADTPWDYYRYDWMISVDGNPATRYTGTAYRTGNQWVIEIASWLTAGTSHIVTISPYTEDWGWARAFCCLANGGWAQYITEVIQDRVYVGFADSYTSTGDRFREGQYAWCSLISFPKEILPDTVTTIWNYYRARMFVSETNQSNNGADEVCPNSVTSIWNYFRYSEHFYDRRLLNAGAEALSSNIQTIGSSFREGQYLNCFKLESATIKSFNFTNPSNKRTSQFNNCSTSSSANWLTVTINGNVVESWLWTNSAGLGSANVNEIRVPSALLSAYQSSSDWSDVSSKFIGV